MNPEQGETVIEVYRHQINQRIKAQRVGLSQIVSNQTKEFLPGSRELSLSVQIQGLRGLRTLQKYAAAIADDFDTPSPVLAHLSSEEKERYRKLFFSSYDPKIDLNTVDFIIDLGVRANRLWKESQWTLKHD